MTTLLVFLGAYLALTLALMVAVRPYRARLMALASELSDPLLPADVRDLAHRMVIYAYSMRVAPIHVFWYATMLLKPSWQVRQEAQEFAEEHPAAIAETRFDELFELYIVSTAAMNPAFGALALALRALFRLKARTYAHKKHTSEQPVLMYAQLKEAA